MHARIVLRGHQMEALNGPSRADAYRARLLQGVLQRSDGVGIRVQRDCRLWPANQVVENHHPEQRGLHQAGVCKIQKGEVVPYPIGAML